MKTLTKTIQCKPKKLLNCFAVCFMLCCIAVVCSLFIKTLYFHNMIITISKTEIWCTVLCSEACKKKIKAFEEEFEQNHGYRVGVKCSIVELSITETWCYFM